MTAADEGAPLTLFVKKLPRGCEAESVRLAFAAHGDVTGVKMLQNRRAIVDLRRTNPELKVLLAAAEIQVSGQPCPLILPDDGGIQPGAAGRGADPRALQQHCCALCALSFPTPRKLEAHMACGLSHRPPPPVWQPERLEEFDLSPNTMVSGMDPKARAALSDYLAHAAPRWPELEKICTHVAQHHPKSLRLKELLETLEYFRVVGQFLWERQKALDGGLDEIFDLACGHGLLGVLLAYRFPDTQVTCVDLEPRECLVHYREAWARHGQPAAGHAVVLDNLRFAKMDVADVALGARTAACCIHACNEANLLVMRKCRDAGASYAVMPCCLPGDIYRADCRHLPDEVRYPAMVGIMAGQFAAAKLRGIDARITNRNLICMGPQEQAPPGGPTGGGTADVELVRSYRHL